MQTSETFKLTKFWEQRGSDKTNLQVAILRILVDGQGTDRERSGTVNDKINSEHIQYTNVNGQQRATLSGGDVMHSFVVPRDSAAPPVTDSKYEKAPTEDINNPSILAMNMYNQSADEQRVKELENECADMRNKISAMVKQEQNSQGNQAQNYQWQTSDGDKPGSASASYSIVQLIIVFAICTGIGSYLMK